MDLTNITKRLGEATTALAKADNDLKLEIARGDYWGAALSTVSMVPYLGDAVRSQ